MLKTKLPVFIFHFIYMVNKICFCCFALLVLLFGTNKLLAQTDKQTDSVMLQQYSRQTVSGGEEANFFWLVQVKEETVILFKQEYKNYIQRQINNTWFVIKKKPQPADVSAFIKTYAAANNNWKLSASLLHFRDSLPLKKSFTFLVQATDSSFLKREADSNNIAIVYKDDKTKTYQITATPFYVLQTLVNDSAITFIDIKSEAPKEEMVINDYDNSVNAINLFFSQYPAVTGAGLTVSVKENLFDTTDIDFKNRYLPTSPVSSVTTTHATTMATLIGGGGNSFHTGKGVAPASRISSSDFANLLPDGDSSYARYKISVQNHSYGTGVQNFYGADAAAFDQSARNNPQLVYVFSAGNSGTVTDSIGPYKNVVGFANLTGSFKQAKNIITVGSVDSFYQVSALSSKGPAYDGRIKPELVAYGNDGSSGAAAITSGTALAVQSAYASLHHDSLPDAALVKAILLNSADDVYNAGPDYYSGYGNVNAYKAALDAVSDHFFKGKIGQNRTDSFVISVPANIKNIKLILVWNDEPAQPNAFTALVNDLDVTLKKQNNGDVFLPWILNASPDSGSLLLLPQRGRDSLNVAEQITLSAPAPGNYTVYVKGHQVSSAGQPYFVVYEMDTANRFGFVSPSAADHFMAGKKGIIRWNDTHNDNATGRLEYSVDAGLRWQLIDGSVSLIKKYLIWQVPDTSVVALMRMTIGNNVYTSDTFDFSRQLSPHVVINCPDSALIRWTAISGVHRYKISLLGNQYLEDYATVNDTGIVIKKGASPYVAVAPLFDNEREGVKSYTFNYNTQGAGCYINNFLADLTPANKAQLSLTLGITTGVDSVQFQQFIRNRWQTVAVVSSITNTNVGYVYSPLLNGINTFRAVVWLNSNNIISSEAGVLYFMKGDFIAKPNPLPQGQNLSLLSSTLVVGTLVVYDVLGRKLWQQNITDATNVIQTNALSKGIYFLVIYDGKQRVFRSKLIVE